MHISRCLTILVICIAFSFSVAEDIEKVDCYDVFELTFKGPVQTPRDYPAKDITLQTVWAHESGSPKYTINGFWDSDGKGGISGNVYKVRFCPTKPGSWFCLEVHSNNDMLDKQHQGLEIQCLESENHGFWIPEGSWFKRSDGTHQYWVGNTHYDFISMRTTKEIIADIEANREYFGKLRFCLQSFRDENQKEPLSFFTGSGNETSDRVSQHGNRPNPAFFFKVDAAVQAGLRTDLICDLILGGTIQDQAPVNPVYINYVAARYGAYPNVWITIGQEWNEQVSAEVEHHVGTKLRETLAYPIPLSTHATRNWDPKLNGDWNTHAILQGKLDSITDACDSVILNRKNCLGKPVVNDENGYEGEMPFEGILPGCLGTFIGGGYPTTGQKHASKKGQYFWGDFDTSTHTSAKHLKYMTDFINKNIEFWKLKPVDLKKLSYYKGFHRMLTDGDGQYVIASMGRLSWRSPRCAMELDLREWEVTQIDIFARTCTTLTTNAKRFYQFGMPPSNAVLTYFKAKGPSEKTTVTTKTTVENHSETVVQHEPTALHITTKSEELEVGVIGENYSDDLEAAGGTAPYSWRMKRRVPGLKVIGSQLEGVPTKAGKFKIYLIVKDAKGKKDKVTVWVTIK